MLGCRWGYIKKRRKKAQKGYAYEKKNKGNYYRNTFNFIRFTESQRFHRSFESKTSQSSSQKKHPSTTEKKERVIFYRSAQPTGYHRYFY